MAQSKRSEILTFELLDWDLGSLYFLPLPYPQVFIYLEWTGALLSRQRASPGRQRMHFRVWVKRRQSPSLVGPSLSWVSSCSQPPTATWNGFGLLECST